MSLKKLAKALQKLEILTRDKQVFRQPSLLKIKPEKLVISFSGGRTSAVMTKFLLELYKNEIEIIVTFANTGCEHEDTLRFINDCDKNWNFRTIWLECQVTHESNKGVGYKIVTYETASRNGEPFRDFISKYGIPNKTTPQCTARLKTDVMEKYLFDHGFYRSPEINYYTAIGIRSDEIDRVSSRRKELKFLYPLVEWGWTKEKVIEYMNQFSWNLKIPEHYGNCVWCWKKSLRKHLTIAKEHPEFFDFPSQMEKEFGEFKADLKAGYNGKRYFFRQHMCVNDIIALSKEGNFIPFSDTNIAYDDTLDRQGSCGEVCDVYSEKEYE